MAFDFPASYRYADSHEYAWQDADTIRIGLSAYAVDQLGDIVFVDLPEVGAALSRGSSFGTVESVKAVEEMYAPSVARFCSAMKLCSPILKNFRRIPTVRAGCW